MKWQNNRQAKWRFFFSTFEWSKTEKHVESSLLYLLTALKGNGFVMHGMEVLYLEWSVHLQASHRQPEPIYPPLLSNKSDKYSSTSTNPCPVRRKKNRYEINELKTWSNNNLWSNWWWSWLTSVNYLINSWIGSIRPIHVRAQFSQTAIQSISNKTEISFRCGWL